MGAEKRNQLTRIPGRVWDLVTGRYVARPLNAIQIELAEILRGGNVHHAEMMEALKRHADTFIQIETRDQAESARQTNANALREAVLNAVMTNSSALERLAEQLRIDRDSYDPRAANEELKRIVETVLSTLHADFVALSQAAETTTVALSAVASDLSKANAAQAELDAILRSRDKTLADALKEGSTTQTVRLEAIEKSLQSVSETVRSSMGKASHAARTDAEGIAEVGRAQIVRLDAIELSLQGIADVIRSSSVDVIQAARADAEGIKHGGKEQTARLDGIELSLRGIADIVRSSSVDVIQAARGDAEAIRASILNSSDSSSNQVEALKDTIEASLDSAAGRIQKAVNEVAQNNRVDSTALKGAIEVALGEAANTILAAVGQASTASQSDAATLIGTIEKSLEPLKTEISAIGASIKDEFERRRAKTAREELEAGILSYAPALRHPSTLDTYPPANKLEDFPDGKLVIFGLQKAGNTWLLALLADTFNLTPYFNTTDEKQFGARAVVSTHDPISAAIRSRRDFVHGVCLMRDLRDMVASYFHYMQTASYQDDVPRAKYADIETFYYDWFLSRMVPAYRWHTYWDEYAAAGVPVLRFERLVADPAGELARLFERWGQPYDTARLRRAVDRNTFKSLKKSGRTIGGTKVDSSHFRRGGVGTYVEELPPKIIADINARFGDTLRRWGYDVS